MFKTGLASLSLNREHRMTKTTDEVPKSYIEVVRPDGNNT